MTRLWFALAATLALSACGGDPVPPPAGLDASTPKETACGDQIDDDGDGKTDCDDPDCAPFAECTPVEPPTCTMQRDCGNIVDEVYTRCCLAGKCVPPGPKTLKNDFVTAQVFFDLTFKSTLTGSQKPLSVALRLLYPEKLDKTPLSCADVIGKISDNTKNCVDSTTRSVIDKNANFNQVFRGVSQLSWNCGGTECQFSNMFFTVPQGQNFVLYGEAWYGPRELNEPTGQCAAYYCVEGKSVTSNDQHFALTFQ